MNPKHNRCVICQKLAPKGRSTCTLHNAENTHKVKAGVWKRWSPNARLVFNELYEVMAGSQGLFLHPKTVRIPDIQWKTTAWNAAWIAADAVEYSEALEESEKVA